MSKDGRGTEHGVAHSEVRDPSHKIHKGQQRKRKASRVLQKASGVRWRQVRVASDGDYPIFESKLTSFLGDGETYRIQRDSKGEICGIEPENGKTWQADLNRWGQAMTWYSIPKKLKSGAGWTRRKIRDRTRLFPGDKRPRPDSDVMRRTNDLRPDHSRALQKICERGLIVKAFDLAEEFCWESAKRWEELNPGRRVDHVSLHADSGQLHRDVWHSGMVEVPDVSAPKGVRRDRMPYRVYGVGPGACAYSRHLKVMEEAFGTLDPTTEITRKIVESDIATATAQNDCAPRDLAFQEWLDDWLEKRLREIDAAAVEEARREYAEHLREGYRTEKIGYHSAKSRSEYKAEIERLQGALKESEKKARENLDAAVEQDVEVIRLAKLYGESKERCEVLEEQNTQAKKELSQIRKATARAARVFEFSQLDPAAIIDELRKQLTATRLKLDEVAWVFNSFIEALWNAIPSGIDELRKIIKITADIREVALPKPEMPSLEPQANKDAERKLPPPSGLKYPEK